MKAFVAVAVAAISLLIGCASVDVTDPSSRYYEIPAGSTVVVQQAIAIPPDSAHVILQGAKVVAPEALRRYDPFCEIEVNDVFDTGQLVRPGRFSVTRVVRQQELGAVNPPVLVAGSTWASGNGIGTGALMLSSLDAPFALNAVHLRLKSSEQPNVRELRCAAGWAIMPSAVYLTLAEMRSTLGALVSIEIR
jgi:hypothetical protein